jgi:hypothetical protein
MDECSRLQGVIGALLAQVASGELPQFLVDMRQQLGERSRLEAGMVARAASENSAMRASTSASRAAALSAPGIQSHYRDQN